jgi:hypothetical protein
MLLTLRSVTSVGGVGTEAVTWVRAGATAYERAVPDGGSATDVVGGASVEATANKKATMEVMTRVMAEATAVEVTTGVTAKATPQVWRGAPASREGWARNRIERGRRRETNHSALAIPRSRIVRPPGMHRWRIHSR